MQTHTRRQHLRQCDDTRMFTMAIRKCIIDIHITKNRKFLRKTLIVFLLPFVETQIFEENNLTRQKVLRKFLRFLSYARWRESDGSVKQTFQHSNKRFLAEFLFVSGTFRSPLMRK